MKTIGLTFNEKQTKPPKQDKPTPDAPPNEKEPSALQTAE